MPLVEIIFLRFHVTLFSKPVKVVSITLASNNVVVASCQGARSRHYGWAPIKILVVLMWYIKQIMIK